MQLKTEYTDVPASLLYDVLHDPDYRRTWDKFMMEAEEIGYLNPNNSVSYYACECIIPWFCRFCSFWEGGCFSRVCSQTMAVW